MEQSRRVLGLDIVRSIAIFAVVGGHFFSLHTPFKDVPFEGLSMLIQGMFAYLLTGIGVPLFLILTGYLNGTKKVSKAYFYSIKRVLVVYILISLLTAIFRIYIQHEALSVRNVIGMLLRFNLIEYGWYIEMYLGLFLLIPFLNVLYAGLPNIKQKLLLLLVLFCMTSMPDFLNRYGLHLVPGFWVSLYPLLYYFIGKAIKEYQPQLATYKALLGVVGLCAITPIGNMLLFPGRDIVQFMGGSNAPAGVLMAILVFLAFYQKDIRARIPARVITQVSLLSLNIYLCSYMFDKLYYPWVIARYYTDQGAFFAYFFMVVPMVFFSATILAFVVDKLYALLLGEKKQASLK